MQTTDEPLSNEPAVPTDPCTLSHPEQTRNVLYFGINKGLVYFAAPILYVGMNQAALLNRLGYNKVDSNLPASMYLWFSPLAVLVAWCWPRVRQLRTVLAINYLAIALSGLLVAGALLTNMKTLVMPIVLLHAAVVGLTLNVIEAFQWEVLGRGVSEKRRGEAFAIAFGAGPLMAAIGALTSQLVLSGEVAGLKLTAPPFPWNFAILFGATAPLMVIGAILALKFELPADSTDKPPAPFLQGVLGGFRNFLSDRLMIITVIAYILIYSGLLVMPSITLFTEEATGRSADSLVNYQQALRFSGKAVIGLLLAQLLIRTSPKMGMLATAFLCLAGPLWALTAPGILFMGSFAILGAGELMGVYFPNYILSLSRPGDMRRNMAFCALIVMPVGNAPLLYGAISEVSSLQASFCASALISLTSILICALMLPKYPRPPQD